jgi:hypothetical protein
MIITMPRRGHDPVMERYLANLRSATPHSDTHSHRACAGGEGRGVAAVVKSADDHRLVDVAMGEAYQCLTAHAR